MRPTPCLHASVLAALLSQNALISRGGCCNKSYARFQENAVCNGGYHRVIFGLRRGKTDILLSPRVAARRLPDQSASEKHSRIEAGAGDCPEQSRTMPFPMIGLWLLWQLMTRSNVSTASKLPLSGSEHKLTRNARQTGMLEDLNPHTSRCLLRCDTWIRWQHQAQDQAHGQSGSGTRSVGIGPVGKGVPLYFCLSSSNTGHLHQLFHVLHVRLNDQEVLPHQTVSPLKEAAVSDVSDPLG